MPITSELEKSRQVLLELKAANLCNSLVSMEDDKRDGVNAAEAFDISLVTVLRSYLSRNLGTSAITGIIRFVLSWYWANVG